jgi:hypothetical protein
MCRNPTLEEWEDDSLTPKMGTCESVRTPETSKFDYRGQNALHWGVHYIIGKISKCRCRKWARMSHLNICNTSYDKKKGRESNWQFDSQPQKIRNRPDPGVFRWSATHSWKALNQGYNFALDLIIIGGLQRKLCALKVARIPVVRISGLPLGSLGTKNHLDVALVESYKVYYIGEGGGFPRVRAVMSLENSKSPVARPSTKGAPKSELTNLWLVGCRFKWVIEKLVTLPSLISKPQHAPSTPSSVESWGHASIFKQFRCLSHLDSFWV